MTRITVDDVMIECLRGDIASQADMDAVVNAANAELRTAGGVAGALHRAAGAGLEVDCPDLAPIDPGKAVITGAQDLPNDYVIHCLGPVYGRTSRLTSSSPRATARRSFWQSRTG